jgi:hypothetical protein
LAGPEQLQANIGVSDGTELPFVGVSSVTVSVGGDTQPERAIKTISKNIAQYRMPDLMRIPPLFFTE